MSVRRVSLVTDETYDPGARLCGHETREDRTHYLGGGLWVCFECWARAVLGAMRRK